MSMVNIRHETGKKMLESLVVDLVQLTTDWLMHCCNLQLENGLQWKTRLNFVSR